MKSVRGTWTLAGYTRNTSTHAHTRTHAYAHTHTSKAVFCSVVRMINGCRAYNINNTYKALEHVDMHNMLAHTDKQWKHTQTMNIGLWQIHTPREKHITWLAVRLVFVYKLVINWLDGKCNLIKQTFQCGCRWLRRRRWRRRRGYGQAHILDVLPSACCCYSYCFCFAC